MDSRQLEPLGVTRLSPGPIGQDTPGRWRRSRRYYALLCIHTEGANTAEALAPMGAIGAILVLCNFASD